VAVVYDSTSPTDTGGNVFLLHQHPNLNLNPNPNPTLKVTGTLTLNLTLTQDIMTSAGGAGEADRVIDYTAESL